MKDPRQKRKQLWNVIIPQVCTEVINEMIILAIMSVIINGRLFRIKKRLKNKDKLYSYRLMIFTLRRGEYMNGVVRVSVEKNM